MARLSHCGEPGASVGVVIPADSPDPAGDARRLESLGFGHAALPGSSPARVLLALGATRSLRLLADPAVLPVDLSGLASSYRLRLQPWPDSGAILRLDLSDPASERAALHAHLGSSDADLTVELTGGPQPRLARILALDVLADGLAVRTDGVLYAEDLAEGDEFDLGEFLVTEDDILAFAEKWDPLDFHTDAELAVSSPLGVLCASGIHTQAIMQRLSARSFHRRLAIVAGRGMHGMRLRAPVTAGMRLRGRTQIAGIRRRPNGRSVVTVRSTLVSGDEPILEQTGEMLVQQRHTAIAPSGTT